MALIKPLLSYSKGIYGGMKISSATETKNESSKEELTIQNTQKKQVSSDEVFQYMTSTYAQVKPTKINVTAHVTSESKERIGQSITQFENMFNKTLNIIKNEFGDILSDDAMKTLTLQLLT